jgi:hypothetical protein
VKCDHFTRALNNPHYNPSVSNADIVRGGVVIASS